MRESIEVKGYVRKKGNYRVAICITLGLAAQGDSRKEVNQKLHEMRLSYIEGAYTTHEMYKDQLLKRKAIWSQRIYYYYLVIRNFALNMVNIEGYSDITFSHIYSIDTDVHNSVHVECLY